MSNEALTAVAKAAIKPSGRKFVAMALADYADEEWSCYPSVAQLATYTAQGEKTVRDHLDALEEDGVIKRDRQRRDDGTLGRYRFVIQWRNLPVDNGEQSQRRISPVANFARGEKQPKPAADFATLNPQEEPSLGKQSPREELLRVLDTVHANAVIDHRQRIRKPLTAYAATLLAKQLSAWRDANEAADLMIANGWQGFRPEWVREDHRRQASGGRRSVASAANELAHRLEEAEE